MFDIIKLRNLCFIVTYKLNYLMHTSKTLRAFKLYYTKINRFILWYTVKLESCLAVRKIKSFYKRMENVHTEVLCREMKKKIEYLILKFLFDAHAKEFWSSNVPFYFFYMMNDILHDTIMIQQYIWKCTMRQWDKFWHSALFSHDDKNGFVLVQM